MVLWGEGRGSVPPWGYSCRELDGPPPCLWTWWPAGSHSSACTCQACSSSDAWMRRKRAQLLWRICFPEQCLCPHWISGQYSKGVDGALRPAASQRKRGSISLQTLSTCSSPREAGLGWHLQARWPLQMPSCCEKGGPSALAAGFLRAFKDGRCHF